MQTLLIILIWGLLLVVTLLIGVNRSMRKRHAALEVALIDECNTGRNKIIARDKLIKDYQRLQEIDTAMVERTLKEVERLKESTVELLAKIALYDTAAGAAQQQLEAFTKDVRASGATGAQGFIRHAIDNLKQITG